MRLQARISAALALSLLALPVAAETLRFTAQLAAETDAQPKLRAGKGVATLSLDTTEKTVSWTIEYSGLPKPPKAVGCGALEAAGGPAIMLTSNLASPIRGSKSLTDADIVALKTGDWVCLIGTGEDDAEIGGVLQPAR